ncbi:MAG: 50S ribosomal protein L24 [Clostridia bacterium]
MIKNLSVKKGDKVLVIAGKDNGKIANVISTLPSKNKVVVEGVNIATKHKKARKQDQKSKIEKVEAAFDASNVMVVCGSCGKATRVAHKEVNGKMVRVCKKCGQSLDKAVVKEAKKAKKPAVKVEEKEVVTEANEQAAKVSTTKKPSAPRATKKIATVKTTTAKTATRVAVRKTAPSSGK